MYRTRCKYVKRQLPFLFDIEFKELFLEIAINGAQYIVLKSKIYSVRHLDDFVTLNE